MEILTKEIEKRDYPVIVGYSNGTYHGFSVDLGFTWFQMRKQEMKPLMPWPKGTKAVMRVIHAEDDDE